MRPQPIHLIVARLRRMKLSDRIAELRVMVAKERPHSIRRNELQSLLNGALIKQLKQELRKMEKAA